MSEPTESTKYQRMMQLSDLARQRYLEAGGDPQRAADDRHLTDAERKEFLELGRQLSGVQIIDGVVHCQGRSWKLTKASLSEPDRAANPEIPSV